MAMVLREYQKSLKLGGTEILAASPPQPTLLESPVAPRARFLEVKSRVICRFVFATVLLLSALYAGKGLSEAGFPGTKVSWHNLRRLFFTENFRIETTLTFIPEACHT